MYLAEFGSSSFNLLVKLSVFSLLFYLFLCFFVLTILNTSVRASLAQWLEQWSRKPGVESSDLSRGCGIVGSAIFFFLCRLNDTNDILVYLITHRFVHSLLSFFVH